MKVKEFLSEIPPGCFLSLPPPPALPGAAYLPRGGRSPPLTLLGGLLASCSGFSFSLWNAGGEDTAGRFLKVSSSPAPDFAPFPFIWVFIFLGGGGGGAKFSIYY